MAQELHAFALVVVRHPITHKFLLVEETDNRGWWLPGGHVDPGETFFQAAIRETEEEAGVHIRLTGILSVQHSPRHGYDRMRVIFLGEPIDPNEPPKSIPDKESDRAEWVSLADLATRKLRGSEPQTWFSYVTQGRHVAPLDMLGPER